VAGSGAFSTVRGKRGAALALPPSFVGGLLPGARIEFYTRILDGNAAVLADLGTAQVPYVFTVRTELQLGAPSHWYTKWWVWTIIGVAVASASTTAAILLTRGGNDLLRVTATVR